jgi:(1->4)-alpha-D-glucan 1-alpha-D-glucosylmutase
LALTQRLLHLRRDFAGLFERGSYEPLTVRGRHATHVIAFARSWKRQRVVVALGRHFSPLTGAGRHWPRGWDAIVEPGDTKTYADALGTLAGGRPHDLRAATLFQTVPLSVLRRI